MTTAEAQRVANAIGARAYKECSALKIEVRTALSMVTRCGAAGADGVVQGVDDVFEAATRASMLMREGVPAHLPSGHERRGSRARNVEGTKSGCCVVC